MSQEKILIVEDDKNILKLVKYNLEKADFQCTVAVTGEEALQILDREAIQCVVLDVMLPKMDGFEVCKRIKQDSHLASTPIIMLTARGEEVDRIVGLELGADDYMVKPFSPRELVLRIKAILKRHQPKSDDGKQILAVGKITVDIPRHKVTVQERDVNLTSMEFNLLVTLMKRQGRVQSRDQLLQDVWDLSSDVTTRTVDTHIKRLRQKLGKEGKLIETIRGHGYRLADD